MRAPADQRDEANQAMRDAQEQLRDAQRELGRVQSQTRSTPMVYAGPPPDFPRSGIPAGAMDIAIAFFITCAVIVVGWPISRALGRRVERRGASPVVEAGMTDQLQRIEQAVEAMAIEVERISESQRLSHEDPGEVGVDDRVKRRTRADAIFSVGVDHQPQ